MRGRLYPFPSVVRGGDRPQMAVLSLMVLVACCGVLFWLARVAWENSDRDRSAVADGVRGLRSRDPAQRLLAAHELARFGGAARDVAVRALIAALADPDAAVRCSSAEALAQVAVDPIEARSAALALRGSLKDGHSAVRIASASAPARLGA